MNGGDDSGAPPRKTSTARESDFYWLLPRSYSETAPP
jgi:hypothetical protein